MTPTEMIVEARKNSRVVKFRGNDWVVLSTKIHCVVGPIAKKHFMRIQKAWSRAHDCSSGALNLDDTRTDMFQYCTDFAMGVQTERDRISQGVSDTTIVFTNNPLVLREFKLGEVSLAFVDDDGELRVCNFLDFVNIEAFLAKCGTVAQVFLNYAEGGSERTMRLGLP